jgi:hypothetical protein
MHYLFLAGYLVVVMLIVFFNYLAHKHRVNDDEQQIEYLKKYHESKENKTKK